ncbi:hypothetical protein ABW19_dt0204578 [Dactylella cylindrospora]|nr:hypothetical protein ABW19_dt0204578 [Dactylella cylindrospora]
MATFGERTPFLNFTPSTSAASTPRPESQQRSARTSIITTGQRYNQHVNLLKERRRNYYATIWQEYLLQRQYPEAETALKRYIDIQTTAGQLVDVDCYYGLARALGYQSKSNETAEKLEQVPMSRLSPHDRARMYLLKCLVKLDQGYHTTAQDYCQNALALHCEHDLDIEGDCYYLSALVNAFEGNYVEAVFFKTLIPHSFELSSDLRFVIQALKFRSANWVRQSGTPGASRVRLLDISTSLPIPAQYDTQSLASIEG